MKIELAGYAPDLDPTTPGIFSDCDQVIPTIRGFAGAPVLVQSSVTTALAAACRGAATITKLDNLIRTFAGTAAKLFENSGSGWTDRTRAVGGDYALTGQQRWRFAQFADATLAAGSVAVADKIQRSTTAVFADVASAPAARIVETVNQFVFALNTNDTVNGLREDAWWCSALADETSWAPSIATQAATDRLKSAPGPIRAGRRFGDQIVVYKDAAMYLGTYVGPPLIWRFVELPGRVGAPCQEAVVNIGTDASPRHMIFAADDVYVFDGANTVPVGVAIKRSVLGEIVRANIEAVILLNDRSRSLVYCWHPVSGTTNPDKCVVYNYKTGRWGRADRTVQIAFEFIPSGPNYADLGNQFSTYGDFPSAPYGTFAISSVASSPAVFDTDHKLKTLTGATGTARFNSGDIGDDRLWALLLSVKPRWFSEPSSANMTNFYRENLSSTLVADSAIAQSSEKKFDVAREARWHRVQINTSGNFELAVIDAEVVPGAAY